MIYPVYTDYGRFRKFGKKYKEGFHLGYDFDVKAGTPVRAIKKGLVIFSGLMNGFGSLYPSTPGGVVIIKHECGIHAIYGHLENIIVKEGEVVEEKYLIGFVNNFKSGSDILPHLHFGLYTGEKLPSKYGYDSTINNFINPIEYFKLNDAKWPGV